MDLKKGQIVHLTTGGMTCTVIEELGRGGQGTVYKVDLGGKKMALKWYHIPPDEKFYKNLQKNVDAGAPSDAFIWPEFLTVRENGSYGYVMKLRPSGYYEFGQYLLARHQMKSLSAIFAAAMKICNGFKLLHRYGYSYQDLNDGNFFIRPDDGDVLICDNDNVYPQGEKSGIMGKARYMAPEIVAGGIPDKYSDRYSLTVLLFMLIYLNHPLEGARVAACPCMTEGNEKKFYGSEALFIYDRQNNTNLPVRGVHTNVIRRWPAFPKLLRETFMDQLSQEKLKNPTTRMVESMWENVIAKVRDTLVICPKCRQETFVEGSQTTGKCIECGAQFDITRRLVMGDRSMVLTPGTCLFIDMDNKPDIKVQTSSSGEMMLQNVSTSSWNVETPSGKIRQVNVNDCLPTRPGLKISFGTSIEGAPNAKAEVK
ncbi:MAG: serine/threonine protein kinase [Bacteroidaceae bacterium]|nr:serine/threonine protein kinase [Bacteroidaceae bacterium]